MENARASYRRAPLDPQLPQPPERRRPTTYAGARGATASDGSQPASVAAALKVSSRKASSVPSGSSAERTASYGSYLGPEVKGIPRLGPVVDGETRPGAHVVARIAHGAPFIRFC